VPGYRTTKLANEYYQSRTIKIFIKDAFLAQPAHKYDHVNRNGDGKGFRYWWRWALNGTAWPL